MPQGEESMKRYRPEWRTRLAMWLAWHLPHKIVYWCVVRVVTHAGMQTLADVEMGAITAVMALETWEASHE